MTDDRRSYEHLSRRGKQVVTATAYLSIAIGAVLLTISGAKGTSVDGPGPGLEIVVLLGLNPEGEADAFWLWVGRVTLYLCLISIVVGGAVLRRQRRSHG